MSDLIYAIKRNPARTYQMRVAEFIVKRTDEGRSCSREEIAQAVNIDIKSVDVALRALHARIGRVMHPSEKFEVDVHAIAHMDNCRRGSWFAPLLGRFLVPELDGRENNRFTRVGHTDYLVVEQ